MKSTSVILLALASAGCDTTDYETLCARNDASVSTADCYDQAWRSGRAWGYGDGYDSGYTEVDAACISK